MKRTLASLTALVVVLSSIGTSYAGNIFLTGHDVLFHSGQNSYDATILDYLRNGDAKAGYDIAVVGSGIGQAIFGGGANFAASASGSAIPLVGSLTGYGSATYYQTGTGASWATILAADALVILTHSSVGGALDTAGSAEVNSNSAAITAAFNTGMDIWGNSGTSLSTYYDFLPPSAVATGASIAASSGFFATPAGTSIGIVDPTPGAITATSMINGFPTHNSFPTFASAFTVFETRPVSGAATETISIGLQNATIGDGGITLVPEPSTFTLFGVGCVALLGYRWRRKRQSQSAA